MLRKKKSREIETENEWVAVKKSPVHGHGCFAAKAIPKDTRIMEYVGEKITKTESNRRGLLQEEKAKDTDEGMVYIFQLNKRYDIDGNVPENIARFANHCCEPNCEAVNIRGRIWYVALRDIEPGEEITIDYAYELEHFLDHPCYCGAESCVGYIVRKDQRWRVRRKLGLSKPVTVGKSPNKKANKRRQKKTKSEKQ